tara:strand:- start:309 stop:848 length:540 start_codon:yes stop_codon:yes gene_type:complete
MHQKFCEFCGDGFVSERKVQRFCGYSCARRFQHAPFEDRLLAGFERGPGCWLWNKARITKGYGHLRRDGTMVLAHRAMFEMFVGPIPDGMFVLHKCDNPPCVNPEHLFLGTQKENMADKIAKGRGNHAKGEANSSAKLTEAQVLEIRSATEIHREIGVLFGVAQQTVSNIKNRRTWQHI